MATPTTLPASFTAGQVLTAAQMNNLRGAFRVLQVVSTTKTDTYTMSSSTFATVTGLTATITPSSTSSKILVIASVNVSQPSATAIWVALRRDSTNIAIGDAAGSRIRTSMSWYGDTGTSASYSLTTLDSPASTSAITYGIGVAAQTNGQPVYINRSSADSDSTNSSRSVSTITVLEISA